MWIHEQVNRDYPPLCIRNNVNVVFHEENTSPARASLDCADVVFELLPYLAPTWPCGPYFPHVVVFVRTEVGREACDALLCMCLSHAAPGLQLEIGDHIYFAH
ncbi:hypothetical protein VNO77_06019 [Canavalia gladiata]|uniref:Uncharacterized protein n=1 Tax=Canavalia gladiata TaxID=3824 RepID=A0AAN9R661_CANGL